MEVGLFDRLPLWVLFALTVLVIAGSVAAGHRLGRYRQKQSGGKEGSVGQMVGATLGLLAFMLAFTFGYAANRFEERRKAALTEANAIGTAYLRTSMLPEPVRTEAAKLLRQYVDVRLEGTEPGKTAEAIKKSEELHHQLWAQGVAAIEKERSPITSMFIQSLNQVIDVHSERLNAVRSRVPKAIWIGLYLLAILAMSAMGYNEGLTSNKHSAATIAAVLAFSCVLVLIADLDRPGEGLLKVSQQAMIDVRNSIFQSASPR